jgi:hypothetical protein
MVRSSGLRQGPRDLELIAYFPGCDTGSIWNDASNSSSIVACVFVAAVKFLPSRCLTKLREYIYRHTDWWEGFMKYVVEMGSGAMIYIPSFIKIGLGIQGLTGGIHTVAPGKYQYSALFRSRTLPLPNPFLFIRHPIIRCYIFSI